MFKKIVKNRITGTTILMVFVLFFLASQNVHESLPAANFPNDQLLEIIDSLQNELAGYKDRESIFLRQIDQEEYIVTAYLPIDSVEGRYSGLTSTGAMAKPGFTVAVDPEVVTFNSWILIEGLGWRKAQDTGNAITGKKIDLCLSTTEEAKEFGVRKIKVKILKEKS
jgi:3D (Asp-Asp-Asp) domain-containing protein